MSFLADFISRFILSARFVNQYTCCSILLRFPSRKPLPGPESANLLNCKSAQLLTCFEALAATQPFAPSFAPAPFAPAPSFDFGSFEHTSVIFLQPSFAQPNPIRDFQLIQTNTSGTAVPGSLPDLRDLSWQEVSVQELPMDFRWDHKRDHKRDRRKSCPKILQRDFLWIRIDQRYTSGRLALK